MKTYTPKPRDIERRWYVIDANGAVLGRLASEVAAILRGKHKPMYAPHMDTGDHVIVVNAAGVRLTGGKLDKKMAYRHSGYPGGLTATPYARLLADRPQLAVEKAVKGMLPHNRLGRAMVKKLQVYPGPEHPHQAQKPTPLPLGEVPPWNGLPVRERVATAIEPKAPATRRAKPSSVAAKKTTAKKKKTTAKKTTAKKTTAKKTTAKTASTAKAAGETTTRRRRTKKEE